MANIAEAAGYCYTMFSGVYGAVEESHAGKFNLVFLYGVPLWPPETFVWSKEQQQRFVTLLKGI